MGCGVLSKYWYYHTEPKKKKKKKKVCGFPGRAASRSHSRSCHDGTPSIDSAKGRLSMHQGRRHPLSLNFAPMPRDTNGTPDARLPTTIEKKKCRKERGGYFSSRLDHTRRPLSRRAYVLLYYIIYLHEHNAPIFFLVKVKRLRCARIVSNATSCLVRPPPPPRQMTQRWIEPIPGQGEKDKRRDEKGRLGKV